MKIQIPPYVHTYPAPAVLIGCGTVEKPNLITCSWFGTVCSEPPTVSVSVRPSRFSFDLIREQGEFTANIPHIDQLEMVKFCGTKSGRDTDKFKELNIMPVPCEPLKNAPMVKEFPLSLGCRIKQEHELGTHWIFIAEVVSIHCDEKLKRPSGRVDPFCKDQVVYLDGKYWKLKKA